MEENIAPKVPALQIDNGNTPFLIEAAKWGKFLGIIGFIICILIIVFGIFSAPYLSDYFNRLEGNNAEAVNVSDTFLKFFYFCIALLYFFPSWFIFNFAFKMQSALKYNDQVTLNTSFKNLKSFLKYWGILLIILICIYAVSITMVVIMGLGLNM